MNVMVSQAFLMQHCPGKAHLTCSYASVKFAGLTAFFFSSGLVDDVS